MMGQLTNAIADLTSQLLNSRDKEIASLKMQQFPEPTKASQH
jgi:hypothetical protein